MSAVPTQSAVIYYPGYSQQTITENLTVQQISSITQANPCVITTQKTHGYPAGINVTFFIPAQFGMVQLNGQAVQVLAVTSNILTVNLNSINYTPFAYPSPLPNAYTPPTVIPNASGPPLPPFPLPYGNENTFEGTLYNNGALENPVQ